jgi:glutamyl/glutaminyl-tRNA synthetase
MSALNSHPMPASAIPSPKSASTKEASGSGLLEGQGKKKQLARGKMWTPLRWALTGKAQGPSVRASIGFLGREETLRRLEIAAGL